MIHQPSRGSCKKVPDHIAPNVCFLVVTSAIQSLHWLAANLLVHGWIALHIHLIILCVGHIERQCPPEPSHETSRAWISNVWDILLHFCWDTTGWGGKFYRVSPPRYLILKSGTPLLDTLYYKDSASIKLKRPLYWHISVTDSLFKFGFTICLYCCILIWLYK